MRGKIKIPAIISVAVLSSLLFVSTVGQAATLVTINSDGAGGQDAYSIFKSYLGSDPIDGPDTGHITEVTSAPVGNAFEFILHNTGDLDGSNTDRQRNEVKVYNGSPDNLKAKNGETFTYRWKFKLASNYPSHSRFCHIFQIKAVDGDDGAPLITFTTDGDSLDARHTPQGATMDNTTTICSTPLSAVKGVWCEATVTAKMVDSGNVSVTVKRVDNGAIVMSGSATKDMWRTDASYNRPKWGIYRGIFDGMAEARIQFANFEIINGTPSSTPTPTPTPTPTATPSENLALNKAAAASSSWSTTYTADKAFDGTTTTRWVSAKGTTNGEWLRVDFGANTTYNQVTLVEDSVPVHVTSFKLQSSDDGTTFTDIPGASGTSIGASKTLSFSPVTSRYLRLYVVTATSDTNINEMGVYYK